MSVSVYRRTDRTGPPRVRFRVDFYLSENDLAGALAEHYAHADVLPTLTLTSAQAAIRETLWASGAFASGDDVPERTYAWAQGEVRRLFGPFLDAARD